MDNCIIAFLYLNFTARNLILLKFLYSFLVLIVQLCNLEASVLVVFRSLLLVWHFRVMLRSLNLVWGILKGLGKHFCYFEAASIFISFVI